MNAFDVWSASLLALPLPFDAEGDCAHHSICVVWCRPLGVYLCDECGAVSVPGFHSVSDFERELTRQFRDMWK